MPPAIAATQPASKLIRVEVAFLENSVRDGDSEHLFTDQEAFA